MSERAANPRRWRIAVSWAPAIVAVAALVGFAAAGQRLGWKVPKFSDLTGRSASKSDDWCADHCVPKSACVECNPDLLPKAKERGWCRTHGVHECPLCNPAVAQLPGRPRETSADRRRADESLAFAPRPPNGSKCRQHQRRIQLESDAVRDRLGIETTPATLGAVTEAVSATGELEFDPTRVARLAPRLSGTVWALLKRVGDPVRAGEVVALVEAADVGKAKGELLQAIGALALREQTVARLKESAGKTVTEQAVRDAEAARADAEVRVLAAGQALTNLGLPVDPQSLRGLAPDEAARRLRHLGLPEAFATALAARSESSNLLPVKSPFDAEVIDRPANEGEAADPSRPLFVVADTRHLWLTLQVRPEDAGRIKPGQSVRFRHDGHETSDTGTVAWVSPAADERTRTVPVRVAWPNENGRHHAGTFGTARVILRQVPDAVVVPSSAVHWEGCCHVVFVRDKEYDSSPYKVFHVRKVRPGASDAALNGSVTEIAAGLLPGEVIATINSGLLRSELLKNDLGAG
jgi:cobalt-zinc-cadmium efflux system membrane fusion protein